MVTYDPYRGIYNTKVKKEEPKPEVIPTGTLPELLEWVGKDKERAKKVLDEETKSSKPRKSLIKELKVILGDK